MANVCCPDAMLGNKFTEPFRETPNSLLQLSTSHDSWRLIRARSAEPRSLVSSAISASGCPQNGQHLTIGESSRRPDCAYLQELEWQRSHRRERALPDISSQWSAYRYRRFPRERSGPMTPYVVRHITGSIFRQRRGRSVYRHGRIDGPRRWLKMGWIEPPAGTGSMGVESWGGV